MAGIMTEKEYVACGGSRCPLCGSENIEAERLIASNYDPATAWSEVKCLDCGGKWMDMYVLAGIVILAR